jgi:hypothetical protein
MKHRPTSATLTDVGCVKDAITDTLCSATSFSWMNSEFTLVAGPKSNPANRC